VRGRPPQPVLGWAEAGSRVRSRAVWRCWVGAAALARLAGPLARPVRLWVWARLA
jgi:hypothetical protein